MYAQPLGRLVATLAADVVEDATAEELEDVEVTVDADVVLLVLVALLATLLLLLNKPSE